MPHLSDGQSRSTRKRWARVPGQMRLSLSGSLAEPLLSNPVHRKPRTREDQTDPTQKQAARTIGISREGRNTKTVTSANRSDPKASRTWLFRLNQIIPSAPADPPLASPVSRDRRRPELSVRR